MLSMSNGIIYEASTGQRIQYLRNKYGISMEELAEAIGTSVDMLKKYEKEIIKKVPYEHIEKLAPALHTSIGYLLCWEPAMFEENNIAAEHMADEENLFEDFLDTDSEALETFWTMQAKTPEERDEVIASGAFNTHIEGYMVLALRAIGYPESEINSIRNVLQYKVFGHVTAEKARKTGEILGVIVDRGKSAPKKEPQQKSDTAVIVKFPFEKKEPGK